MSDLSLLFGHRVQGTSVPEPLDLGFVEGVGEWDIVSFTILGVDTERDGLADSKLCAQKIDSIIRVDLIVVCRVDEGKRQHALFLQVGLVLFEKLDFIQRRCLW
jgi:hypothetical protein